MFKETTLNLKEPSETLAKRRPVIVLNEDKRTMQFHNPTNLEMRKQGLEEIHDRSKLSTPMRTQTHRNQEQNFGYNIGKEEITEHVNTLKI